MADLSGRKTAPLAHIMQAVNAVEEGAYKPGLLADLVEQKDDIGQLVRVIDHHGTRCRLSIQAAELAAKGHSFRCSPFSREGL